MLRLDAKQRLGTFLFIPLILKFKLTVKAKPEAAPM